MCEGALRWEGGQLRPAKAGVAYSHEQGVGGGGGWSGSLGQKNWLDSSRAGNFLGRYKGRDKREGHLGQ